MLGCRVNKATRVCREMTAFALSSLTPCPDADLVCISLNSPIPEVRTHSLLRVRKARATSPDVSSAAAVAVASSQVCIPYNIKQTAVDAASRRTVWRRSERPKGQRRMCSLVPCRGCVAPGKGFRPPASLVFVTPLMQ